MLPAANLGEERAGAAKRRMLTQRVANREKDEPALLRLVDDLERDAGAGAEQIEEGVAVARFADRARRHRGDVGDAVAVGNAAEAGDRGDRGVEGPGADGTE